MFDLSQINFADEALGIIIAVFQAVLIAIITKILLDRAFKDQRLIGKNLQKYGIKRVRADKGGTLSKSGKDVVFGLNGKLVPSRLDLLFITGCSFFRDYQVKTDYIKNLVKNGCKVRILLANPNSGKYGKFKLKDFETDENIDKITDYYFKVLNNEEQAKSFLERSYAMLISQKVKDTEHGGYNKVELKKCLIVGKDETKVKNGNGDHNYQVKFVDKLVDEIINIPDIKGSIELRYYEDEYQMPIIMATSYADEKAKERNEETIYLWTNINAPIKETSESINVFCTVGVDDKSDATFIDDVSKSFEYLWELYEKSNEKEKSNATESK